MDSVYIQESFNCPRKYCQDRYEQRNDQPANEVWGIRTRINSIRGFHILLFPCMEKRDPHLDMHRMCSIGCIVDSTLEYTGISGSTLEYIGISDAYGSSRFRSTSLR